jgi:hypothetical protein
MGKWEGKKQETKAGSSPSKSNEQKYGVVEEDAICVVQHGQ